MLFQEQVCPSRKENSSTCMLCDAEMLYSHSLISSTKPTFYIIDKFVHKLAIYCLLQKSPCQPFNLIAISITGVNLH